MERLLLLSVCTALSLAVPNRHHNETSETVAKTLEFSPDDLIVDDDEGPQEAVIESKLNAMLRTATQSVESSRSDVDAEESVTHKPAPQTTKVRIEQPAKDVSRQTQRTSIAPSQRPRDAMPTIPAIVSNDDIIPVATTKKRPLTPDLMSLKYSLEQCLRFYRNKPLNTKDDSAWSVMHSFLGFGKQTPLAIGGDNGRRTNAVSWMCSGRSCAGYQIFSLANSRIRGREGPGFQGHTCQFLAMLAQIGVDENYPMQISGNEFTVADLIEEEKRTCYAGTELTFKLIALAHYLPSDAHWLNDRGVSWSIPKLIRAELAQPVNGAACGGTHRLMGLSIAVAERKQRGEPLDGEWSRAAEYIKRYHNYTLGRIQNHDGSFSSDWFKRRSSWGDHNRQLQTTGHILEWLVFSLSEDQLRDPRIIRSVRFLANLMIRNRYNDWEVGPRGHALRCLTLYYERVIADAPTMAQKQTPKRRFIRHQAR